MRSIVNLTSSYPVLANDVTSNSMNTRRRIANHLKKVTTHVQCSPSNTGRHFGIIIPSYGLATPHRDNQTTFNFTEAEMIMPIADFSGRRASIDPQMRGGPLAIYRRIPQNMRRSHCICQGLNQCFAPARKYCGIGVMDRTFALEHQRFFCSRNFATSGHPYVLAESRTTSDITNKPVGPDASIAAVRSCRKALNDRSLYRISAVTTYPVVFANRTVCTFSFLFGADRPVDHVTTFKHR